ncbi:hypothetical protein MPSEU_000531100 [Mayamaea pseudoterrestris]|nr:hypothetical protein MPSEU_000531100 [Mayamaea pseudoterrestris]
MIRRTTSDHPIQSQPSRERPIRSVSSRGKRSTNASSVSVYLYVGIISLLFLLAMLWTVSQMNQAIQQTSTEPDAISSNSLHTDKASQQQYPSRDKITPERMLEQFRHRYGKASDHMAAKGYLSFGNTSIEATARRLLEASKAKRPFVMAFAGYSVTVGRGNHFKQSFPFVLGRLLEPLLQDNLQIPSITVRNAAIGGIPSFPYGFCLDHFLGDDADVISWDYSMNEGSGASVLEAYLRQSQAQLSNKRPMVIVLDMNPQRCQLLEKYVQQGYLRDAICVGTAKDAVPKEFLELPEDHRPPGLQHWQEFGAPDSCPGRGPWHPKMMEHTLIAWIMALHFVKAVDRALELQQQPDFTLKTESEPLLFSAPLASNLPRNDPAVTSMLFGHKLENASDSGSNYVMKPLSCRTNFLPATDADRTLSSIVVSGLAHDVSPENIMTERSDAAYHWGWVYDVSSLERETKVKVEKCGGLGYVDMKIALYGVPESGPLRMWLPSERTVQHDLSDNNAQNWFDTIVICEANEKRPDDACHLNADMNYTVGGVSLSSTAMVAGAGEYLKRKTCFHVGVPIGAEITLLKDVTSADGKTLTPDQRDHLGKGLNDEHVGVIVDIVAKTPVTRKKGACCISHVVWEHH